MNDWDGYDAENAGKSGRATRVSPSFSQVKAVMKFMAKHPDLAQRKPRADVSPKEFQPLWLELANIVNSMDGARKSSKGWAKFWADKRRFVEIKKSQIERGKLKGTLTVLDQKVLDLCAGQCPVRRNKKKSVKEEPWNGDDSDSFDDVFSNDHNATGNPLISTEAEDKQFIIIDKLVVVMDQQTTALTQMAEANVNSSKALERIAEASHLQALAVDRLANTFDTINASFHDVRNALLGIDYTMKRFYPATGTQQRENTNIFS